MKIELRRLNDAVHFECTSEQGLRAETDGSPDVGGQNLAPRPMQMLLMAHASCSAIDVVHLLKKMRQPLTDIRVTANGERDPNEVPSVFKKIHLHYILSGDIDPKSAEKAIRLSTEKYCSVGAMLSKTAEITWSYECLSV
ncbi:MAG: OsmC family protein [Chitinophagales bacterium]|nr:OsmC family protein [Chitinophagales bacterium]